MLAELEVSEAQVALEVLGELEGISQSQVWEVVVEALCSSASQCRSPLVPDLHNGRTPAVTGRRVVAVSLAPST